MRMNLKVISGALRRSGRMTEVGLFDETGAPLSIGADTTEAKTIDPLFTPASGFSTDESGTIFITGDDACISFDVYHASALALTNPGQVVLGTFTQALYPHDGNNLMVADDFVGGIRVPGFYVVIGGNGDLSFRPLADHASAANHDFEVYGLRYTLADPAAARRAVAALEY